MAEKGSSKEKKEKTTICKLKKKGKKEKIESLAKNPAFVCDKCGAKADEKARLCKPKAMA